MAAQFFKHEGTNHPMIEAEYDTAFKVWKSDRKKAIIGDPEACIEALGLSRLPNVAFAHIGSGHDAYVGFKDKKSQTGILVRHFIIPSKAAKVRDTFEVKGSPETQLVMLGAVTNGRTHAHRKAANKRWREEVKKGKPVKKRAPNTKTRLFRLGVSPRPRPKIVNGELTLVQPDKE